MSNITDYVRVYGKHKIGKEVPFCELDAVVLSRFSYFPFKKIKLEDKETIASIAKKMRDLKLKDFAWPDDADLIKAMGFSARYGNLRTSDLRVKNSKKYTEQFMAITVHINAFVAFVSYIGTDSTLHGWHEDLNLALYDEVPSQHSGTLYFKRVAEKYSWKKFYLGGHSKGGNIAMYSAIVTPDIYQNRIIAVYSLDGPGMSKAVAEKDEGKPVLPRIKNYIPQDSVVGRLLNHTEKFEVVKSTAKDFWQHNIFSWEVDLKSKTLVRSKATRKSDFVDKTIDHWLRSATKKQKEEFVNLLVKILETSKVGTPVDIAAAGLRAVPALFKSYRALPREDRGIIMDFMRRLAISIREVRREEE